MTVKKILLIGGSGFVGTTIANRLAKSGVIVTVPSRRPERTRAITALPNVRAVQADVHDPATLEALLSGQDAVINLVGILHSRDSKSPYGNDFAKVHVELPGKIVAACQKTGVRRLVHMSALNASSTAPSEYLRSKGAGESAVLNSGLDVTVFRPSVIFGVGDSFLSMFASLLKTMPVFLLGYGKARFQPVHVGDVAEAFIQSLDNRASFGKSYDLVGPKTYTLQQLVEYVNEITATHRPIVGLPKNLARVQAKLLGLTPNPMLTLDNLRSMEVDSVAPTAKFPFDINPVALEAVAPTYLLGVAIKYKLDSFRFFAGR